MSRKPVSPAPAGRRAAPVRGAQTAVTGWRHRLQAWGLHHQASALDAWRRMVAQPLATLMTLLVIAIALALPTGISVMLENARQATHDWDGSAHLSLFLQQDAALPAQQELAARIGQRDDVERVQVITREEALEEFRALSGFGDVINALPENPLPPVLLVYPAETAPDVLQGLRRQLAEMPLVELAQLDVEWVQRLHAMLELAGRIVRVLTLALALAVMLVVVNTIRLAIENRRDEIVVIKTVGGTDSFVRRPFLYTGFLYGFAGGLLAVLLVQLALLWVGSPARHLIDLYGSGFQLVGIGWANALVLPVFSGLLGLFGAWLAVSRHLQELETQLL